MNDNIEISRDKKTPTWAWVGDSQIDIEKQRYKRIVLFICDNGVVTVTSEDEEHYESNRLFLAESWTHYEIIKEPEYRPFATIEEYIEATKDRKDFRIIKKDGKTLYNGINLHYWITGKLTINGNIDSEEFFNNYVWFDDRSPVGVKCS